MNKWNCFVHLKLSEANGYRDIDISSPEDPSEVVKYTLQVCEL